MADEKIFGKSWSKTGKGFFGKWTDDDEPETDEEEKEDD
jgi:hypothetical protein